VKRTGACFILFFMAVAAFSQSVWDYVLLATSDFAKSGKLAPIK